MNLAQALSTVNVFKLLLSFIFKYQQYFENYYYYYYCLLLYIDYIQYLNYVYASKGTFIRSLVN